MREVIKQAKTRLKKGVHAQLLDMPGWEHAQRLAEFYGVETKFISAKEHGKQHGFIPRVPEGAKKQGVGRTPRARRIDATVPPRVGSLSVGNAKPIGRTGPRADRAKSAPPLRPMRQQTNGQWSRTAEGAIAGPSSSSYQARLPGGVLATTAEHSSFAPSPWEIDQEGEADKGPNKSTSEVRSAYVAQGLGSSPRQEGDAEQQHSSPTYAVQPDRASGPRTYTFLPDGEKAT